MDILQKLELKQLSEEEIKNITEIDLINCWIRIIPECLGDMINLQKLDIWSNKITTIPKYFGNLIILQELNFSYNEITTIPECFGSLINLRELNLSYNKITIIPECLGSLTNLQKLVINHNYITVIPECLGNLTNLQKLDLSRNEITTIPEDFCNLINLSKFYCDQNQIKEIPECFRNLTNLRKLDLSCNGITTVPEYFGNLTNLHGLDLSYNKMKTIPNFLGNLTNLHLLSLYGNQITIIPAVLGRLVVCNFNFGENPIEYIPPNVQRLLNRQKIQNNIYSDTQNVHDHNIQESIRQSIYSLLNDKCSTNNYIEEILHSSLQPKTKQILTEYCNDETVHSLNITFSELLKHVWNRIIKHEHKEEIIKILDEEMENAECKCFTGRISRLVNVLNGYYDDVNIKISDNSQIGTIISIIKQQYTGNNIDELKELIRKELIERNIDEKVIKEWIEHVDI
jgi:Leucine-rich repeat (LRR) protein